MPSQLDQLGLRQLIDLLEERQSFNLEGAQYQLFPNKSGYSVKEKGVGSAFKGRDADLSGTWTGYTPLQRLRDFIEYEQRQVAEAAQKELKDALTYLTSQTFATLPQLAKMGHPYAVRHLGPKGGRRKIAPSLPINPGTNLPAKPYFINKQSGEFTQAFNVDIVKPEYNGGMFGLLVSNDTPQAGWLEQGTTGDHAMIARPYSEEAVKLTQKKIAGVISRVESAIRGTGVSPALISQMQVQFNLGLAGPKMEMMQGVGDDGSPNLPFVSQDFFLKR